MLDADLMCNNVAFIADGKIMVIDKPKNLKMKIAIIKLKWNLYIMEIEILKL